MLTIDYMLLGKRLAKIRKEKQLTQAGLAEKTDLTNNHISNIENSHSIPSLETLVKICEALKITPNDLLLGTMTASSIYMNDELSGNLAQCSAKEKRLTNGFIQLLMSERSK